LIKNKRFEDIEACQLARNLTRKVYRLTNNSGFAKDYGLKRQTQETFQVHSSRLIALLYSSYFLDDIEFAPNLSARQLGILEESDESNFAISWSFVGA